MVNLSKRLLSVAQMVPKSHVVADIGCDHAHVAIYLIEKDIAEKVIACDVNKGPLLQADANIRAFGYEEKIELRLSDGFEKIETFEADSVVIAGMGGQLMMRILNDSRNKTAKDTSFILQPQSDLPIFRGYLRDNDFTILEENMVSEDGKYYPMMLAKRGIGLGLYDDNYDVPEEGLKYGELLLKHKNQCLLSFLEKEKKQLETVLKELRSNARSISAMERIETVEHELYVNQNAMRRL